MSLALLFSVGAAYFDLRERKIPNKYNLLGFVLALIIKFCLVFFANNNWHIFTGSLLGLLLGFIIFFPFFIVRLAGAGDVKLLAVLGLLLGWKSFIWLFVFTSLADIMLVWVNYSQVFLTNIFLKASLKEKFENINLIISTHRLNKNPYGFSVAIGSFM